MKVEMQSPDTASLKNIINPGEPSPRVNIQAKPSNLDPLSPMDHFSLKRNVSKAPSNSQQSAQISRMMQHTISKVQTSDEALHKIQAALESGKALALQASQKNSTLEQRRAMQERISRINQNIDQTNQIISRSGTSLIKGINPDDADIVQSLKSDWFEASENLVEKRYGLTGDGSVLNVVLEQSNPTYLAAVDYRTDDTGKAATQTLHINAKAAIPATLPNGGLAPQYDDRVIAHEMVHVVMGRTMNYAALPSWFKEGVAEFLPGADERIAASLSNNGGGMAGAIALQKDFGDGTNKTWKDDSDHYSAATLAVRFLHDNIKSNGHGGGIRDLLADLSANPTETLDDALGHVSSYKNVDAFVNDYVKQGTGADYIFKLYQNHAFSNTDVGAIGGQDVDGGPTLTAETVVPDINNYSEAPLKNFKIEWPKQFKTASMNAVIKHDSQYAGISRQFDCPALGTQTIDLVNNPKGSINRFDKALSVVSAERARLSKVKNQLDHSLRQQIRGTDSPDNQHFMRVQKELSSPDLLASQSDRKPQRVAALL